MTISATQATSVQWRVPVAIRIGYGPSEFVRGPAQACEYLAHRWPFVDGIYHDLAERRCKAAMLSKANAEEARNLFISAAAEARVLA